MVLTSFGDADTAVWVLSLPGILQHGRGIERWDNMERGALFSCHRVVEPN